MEEHAAQSIQNVRSKDLKSGRLIGKGPSSIVYETTWEGKRYARKDFLRVPSNIFEREAAALVGLDHPNVLRTYCWTVDDGSCSLVLELMDYNLLDVMQKRLDSQRKKSPGSDSASQKSQMIDLHKFIEDRQNSSRGTASESTSSTPPLLYPFDTPEALRIILQVAEGMKFLHDNGIAHGDLKPKNILLTPIGRMASSSLDENMVFKVADFGLIGTKMKSRALVSRHARKWEMVRWRAPELLNLSSLQEDEHESSSDSDWDSDPSDEIIGVHVQDFTFMDMARADVYNFGLTCSLILHGEDPYSGLGVKDLANKVTSSGMRPELPPECPDQLSDLIKLCLGERPARPTFQYILSELKYLQASFERLGAPSSLPVGEVGSSSSTFFTKTFSSSPNRLKRRRDLEIVPIGEGGTSLNITTPAGVRRVSDSVYHLGPHATQQVEPPEVEVVFIHGLQLSDYRDAYWKTWVAGANDEDGNAICWPIAWLGEDLPGARIWSLSYDTCAWSTETTGRMGLYLAAEKLVQELVGAKIGQQNCPVVFVCHCLGGLVAKKMVIMAHKKFANEVKYQNFLQNIRGFHYYNTPHGGYKLVDWAEHLPNMGKLVGQLKVINNHVGRLNAEFDDINRRDFAKRWMFSVDFGAKETSWGGQSGMVVEKASAQNRIQNFLSINADHFDVCKPKSQSSSSCYLHVRRSIEDIVKANKERDAIPFELPRHVQGMKERVLRVSKELDKHNFVGLWGVGGIGKTTISKHVFMEMKGRYYKSCFLEDVKSNMQVSQKQLFWALCHDEWQDDNVYEQLQRIKSCILTKKVLVVVDDVDDVSQLKHLKVDAFKVGIGGCKVIVTSRRRDVMTLDFAESEDGIIEVEGLNGEQAFQLFSDYAFSEHQEETIIEKFDGLPWRVVEACGGLPLSLEVIGQLLGRKCQPSLRHEWKGIWEEMLARLKAAESFGGSSSQQDRLWAQLRISYDDMDKSHQSMFLDFACIFSEIDVGREDLGQIWGSLFGVNNLIERSLMKWRGNKTSLVMHDQLRDLGRSIASETKSRVWRKEDGLEFIQHMTFQSSNAIEGLSFLNRNETEWEVKNFEVAKGQASDSNVPRVTNKSMDKSLKESKGMSLRNLRLLNLEGRCIEIVKRCLQLCTKKLKWLRLNGTSISCKDLPNMQMLENLRVLEMRDCNTLEELPRHMGAMVSLTSFDLRNCKNLETLPEDIGGLKHLQVLHLSGCIGLVQLPESLGQLSQLPKLHLDGCSSLVQLPESLGQLSQLSKLHLARCSNLVQLPESLGQLSQLFDLHLAGCNNLVQLPASLGQLSQLSTLHLDGCSSLVQLPESLGQLSQLSELHLARCSNLVQLPESSGQLFRLIELHLDGCNSLVQLPESLGQLSWLIELHLDRCSSLVQLPKSLGQLSQLSKLHLDGCSSLVQLPESLGQLSQLPKLHLDGCSSLVQLPESLGQLSWLSKLHLDGCSSLVQLPESLGELYQLSELHLVGCSSLVRLPKSLGRLPWLSKLHLDGCSSLVQLPKSLGQLSRLFLLHLVGCNSLVQLPESFGQLSQLSVLHLDGCSSLVQLPESLGRLYQLSELHLVGCSSLVQLPESLGQLSQLSKLHLDGCSSLVQLPESLGRLYQLSELHLVGCSSLVQLPESLGQLSQLSKLHLDGCSSLVQLPESLGELYQLSELHLVGCSSLVRLPKSLGRLPWLSKLHLDGCSSLVQLPESLGELYQLSELHLVGCNSLVRLPESLGRLPWLSKLHLDGCSSLVQLPESLGQLYQLSELHLVGCSSLVQLPESLGQLSRLSKLHLDGCSSLVQLPKALS